jgi:hypothetical protein
MEKLQSPLSKNQLELLSMFNNRSLTDEEWGQIKEMIAEFFAAKSLVEAEEAWRKNEWSEEKVQELLKTHLRTPYNSNNQL